MLGAAFLRYLFAVPLDQSPFLLFVPAVFVCALLFDRGSGFFATALSTALAAYFVFHARGVFRSSDAVLLAAFVISSLLIATVTEALRITIHKLEDAERHKSVLLDEMAHRTRNDLAMVSSAIGLQARSATSAEAREALDAANARVMVISKAQDQLRSRHDKAEVELAPYIEELCAGLGDMMRGVRPIAIRVECEPLTLPSSCAVSVGLIVNELVTNSFKYGYPTDRGGIVSVSVRASGENGLTIRVADDGVGCPEEQARPGLGTKLVRLLAKQRGGRVEQRSPGQGCETEVVLSDLS